MLHGSDAKRKNQDLISLFGVEYHHPGSIFDPGSTSLEITRMRNHHKRGINLWAGCLAS
jgi:hypothetical protein